ncbi:tectonin beta-propeller repeat-containing protein 2-like isoform X1 [Styela clava]
MNAADSQSRSADFSENTEQNNAEDISEIQNGEFDASQPDFVTNHIETKESHQDADLQEDSSSSEVGKASSNVEESYTGSDALNLSSFKEYEDCNDILTLIPTRIQHGFRNIDVKILCLDASKSHLLFGSNAGCGFLYNRETGGFIKLLSENKGDVISSVKLFVGIEFQTALGTEEGRITLVIFPNGSTNSTRQVQKFSLGKVHPAEITCMEWSSNGMKLYTGDRKGNIYLIERDFEKDKCNVILIHSERQAIVDLSYRHMILLISTTERTVLLHTNKSKNEGLKPIGSKPFRSGCFGSCFNPGSLSASDLQVFCTRPGYRIWIADTEGRVTNTLLLKDLVSSAHPKIILQLEETQYNKDSQFRKLLFFQEYLLSYSETSLFLIDHTKPCLIASNQELSNILDVAVSTDEIFVLSKDRQLHRISEHPDEAAIKSKRSNNEEKKKDGQSINLQDVKSSFTEMKKNLTPFVGVLQSRMSSLNEGAGQLSQRIQSQAKELQKKLPVVATTLFTKDDKNINPPSDIRKPNVTEESVNDNDNKTKDINTEAENSETCHEDMGNSNKLTNTRNNDDDNTTNSSSKTECQIMSCYDSTVPILDPNMLKKPELLNKKMVLGSKSLDQDFLHSQGHPELLNDTEDRLQSPVKFHFDKLDKIASEDGGEIVFVSKRKKKSRSTSTSSGKQTIITQEKTDIVSNTHNLLTSSELHSSQIEINSDLPGLKVGEQSSQPAVDHNISYEDRKSDLPGLKVEDQSSLATVDHNTLYEDRCFGLNEDSGIPIHDHENTNASNDGMSPTGKNEDRIVVMHKTTGNQLCPKVVQSPKIDSTDFDFFTSKLASLNLSRIEENQITSERTNSDERNNCKEEFLPKQKSEQKNANCTILKPESGLDDSTSELKTSSKIASLSDNAVSTPFLLDSDFISTAVVKSKQEPLFSDSEESLNERVSESQTHNDRNTQIASSIDDIYRIEDGSVDFGSEIETDSDNSYETPVLPTVVRKQISVASSTQSFTSCFGDTVPVKLLDSWSATNLQHQVVSVSGSDSFIWFIDSSNHIYIAEEIEFGMFNVKWKKLAKKGVQLCVSPSGAVAWLVTKGGDVYAAVMPVDFQSLEEPIKLFWQFVSSEVKYATLGHDSAWVVSNSGNVKVQFGISRSNPFSKSWDVVPWNLEKISHITSTRSTIWCRTENGQIFAAELSSIDSSDFSWEPVDLPFIRDGHQSFIQSITSDHRNTIFAVDDKGMLWFLTEDRNWWQVNVSEYIDEGQHLLSHTTLHALPASVSMSVHKVQRWMAGLVRAQHVAVNNQSIWIVHDNQKVNIARGPLTGCRWDITTPLGVAKSSKWQHITTSSIFSADYGNWIGLVWASRPNGEIFCFPSQDVATTHAVTLITPVSDKVTISCMSACKEALWVLHDDGTVYIRSGISADCLDGTEWNKLDTTEQLGKTKLVYLSCGTQNVWAVDSSGLVYFRIGVAAVDRHSLPPAWIPIEGCQVSGRKFIQIECGLSDGSVWALDDANNVFVRTGVSFTLPVGDKWEEVPGSHAQQICISNHTVWGLRIGGNLIRRYGISDRNLIGDYWKKVKGKLNRIAVTPYDELWAIDHDQRLRHQFTSIYLPLVVEAQYKMDSIDVRHDANVDFDFPMQEKSDNDWEMI